MKGYLKTSEIGFHSVVAYRAKVLGIVPIGTVLYHGKHQNIYSLLDADRILAYKPADKGHSIKHYQTLAVIISSPELRYNIPKTAKDFKIRESKLQRMIDEYNKSGCFIVSSKMNYESE